MSTIWKGLINPQLRFHDIFQFLQIIKGPPGNPGPKGPPVSFNIWEHTSYVLLYPHRERREILVPRVKMVKTVLLESLEMMVPLETQDPKDHLVIKAGMQLSEIVVVALHSVLSKASKVVLVNQVMPAHPVGLVAQVLLVNLVGAFLVNLESLEKTVSQVMTESMEDLVSQESLEKLEILLA